MEFSKVMENAKKEYQKIKAVKESIADMKKRKIAAMRKIEDKKMIRDLGLVEGDLT